MDIVNANTLEAEEELLSLIDNIKDVPQSKEVLKYWLKSNLGTDTFNAWIAFDDEPVGFITCRIIDKGKPFVFISFNWVKSGVDVNEKLVEKVENWAKEKDIHRLLFYTKRSPRTFIKKYGFRLVRSVLDKEI